MPTTTATPVTEGLSQTSEQDQRQSEDGYAPDPSVAKKIKQATMPRTANNIFEAKAAALDFLDENLVNTATGLQGKISKKSLKKMLSESALAKSFSGKAHTHAVANADQLFINAEFLETHPDRGADPNFKAIHRLWAPMVFGNDVLAVKITLKELAIPSGSNPIYSIEAIDVEKVKPAGQSADASAQGQGLHAPITGFIENIRQLATDVKREGLRPKIRKTTNESGFIDTAIFDEMVDYGRHILRAGMDFTRWATQMLKDLGAEISPYLRRIWQVTNEGLVDGGIIGASNWNSRKGIRAGIDERSLSRPETAKAIDPERLLRMRMAEWKRQGAQASIREEAAASRAGALREKLDHTVPGTPLDKALFREIADFGRLVFRQGMDYLDWSMRMVRDLGAKVTGHLPLLWRAIHDPDTSITPRTAGHSSASTQTASFASSGQNPRKAARPPRQFEPHTEAIPSPRQNKPQGILFGERNTSDDDKPDRPYTEDEHTKAYETVRSELNAFKAILRELGVEYDVGNDNENVITEEDELLVLYSAGKLTRREKDAVRKGEKWGTASQFTLREELIHVAYIVGLRREWEKSGSELTFGDYVDAENSKVFDNIRDTIETAKGSQRELLTQALFDSFNLYKKNLGEDLPEITAEEFFSNMETQDLKMPFVAEFLRQAAQLKRQGRINEEIFALVKEKLAPWVMKAIARIRSVLPTAYDGGFGPEVKRRLEMLEKEIDSIWPPS